MTDIVEAMADKMAYEAEHMGIQMPGRVARCLARAAIRACHDAGGLVVRKMPGNSGLVPFTDYDTGNRDGWNACLAAVRAAAVEVE